MPLMFQRGEFPLHSGGVSRFKIDCDALADEELTALAEWVAPRLEPFDAVHGIPTGGTRLAELMTLQYTDGANRLLIVDDVFTTGASMERAAQNEIADHHRFPIGLVIFARQPTPAWITAIFTAQEAR